MLYRVLNLAEIIKVCLFSFLKKEKCVKVTILCENTVGVPFPGGLMGEHGLSYLIEDKSTTLYDTGQGVGIINNMNIMGRSAGLIDQIVISHGHYDHTGGLMSVLKNRESKVPVYLHSDAFSNKIALIETPDGNIEFPIGFQNTMEEYKKSGAEFKFINNFTQINDNIFAIADIRRPDGWKSWDVRLKVKDGEKIINDPFNDDLTLLLETDLGPVVLLGCAHAGLVEILDDLSNKTGHKEFYAVIGGTHLGSASKEYINKSIDALKNYRVSMVGTSHCTGFYASAAIMSAFKKEFVVAAVGSSFDF